MSRVEADRELERCRAATSAIAPGEGFTDAILAAIEADAGARDPLPALRRATEALDPGEAFTDAVVARASAQSSRRPAPSWLDGVARSGPIALGLAVVAAAASFLIFVASERDVDAKVASSMDTVEVFE
jgi:hypothetical protein